MPEEDNATIFWASLQIELDRLRVENAALQAQVLEQTALIEQLLQRNQELEARLAKNSRNSSKPPSSDPPFNKPKPKSLRKSSGKPRGGQKGHRGAARALIDDPDQRIVMGLTGQCDCGCCREVITAEVLPERRQVVELIVHREVTEYRIVAGTCACGRRHRSAFPDEISAPVQYAPGVSALAVYLTQYQLLPYRRSAELLNALAGIGISAGSLHAMVMRGAKRLEAPVQAIGQALTRTAVAHADETGVRVGGTLHWLHVLSTDTLTAYFAHRKRGREALDAVGLLAQFSGTLVHDHWCAYDRYAGTHACCNAHHLRELIGLVEADPEQRWAIDMIALLVAANATAEQARAQRLAALPAPELKQFRTRYDAVLSAAEVLNPRNTRRTGKRGRIKQSPAYNLSKRLREHRDDTLRFLSDLRVPFDNNQAERDVRMPKLKQKVSGCFRAESGAAAFATIRAYLSTMRKQSVDLLNALLLTFHGSPPMPRLE